jgi:hypothetical protein
MVTLVEEKDAGDPVYHASENLNSGALFNGTLLVVNCIFLEAIKEVTPVSRSMKIKH